MINLKTNVTSGQKEIEVVSNKDIQPNSVEEKQSSIEPISALGIIYMFISTINFAVMTFGSKLLYMNTNALPFELVYLRGSSMFIFNVFYSMYLGVSIFNVPNFLNNILWIRAILGTVGLTFGLTANKLIPISIATTIFNLQPLFTSLGGYIFLNEKMCKLEIIGMFMSFAGIILVIKYSHQESVNTGEMPFYYYLTPILAALASSGVSLITRKMGKAVHYLINPSWFGMVQAVTVVPAWLAMRSSREPLIIPYSEMYGLAFLCLGGWLGQILMNKSLQIEKAGRVTVVGYAQIPILFFIDALYFHINIRWQVIVGSVLIIFCSTTMGIMKMLNMLD